MSFGFAEGIAAIQPEIDAAINNNVILFAAASNDGGNSGRAYPAWQDGIICIHSTDGYGNKSRYNPTPQNDENFSIVGEYIKSAWPDPNNASTTKRMSGTSFATAVAVGLTALVLDWSHQCMPGLNSFIKLRSYSGLRRILRLMSQERDAGYRYISPFELFAQHPTKIEQDILEALNPKKR